MRQHLRGLQQFLGCLHLTLGMDHLGATFTFGLGQAVAALPGIEELNIGHAIVAQALFVGWENAVREMKRLMLEARS